MLKCILRNLEYQNYGKSQACYLFLLKAIYYLISVNDKAPLNDNDRNLILLASD